MTNQETLEGPPPSDYIISDSQIQFSYLPGHKTFNVGFFGVNEASIAGILHLRSTVAQPLIINSVKVKLLGEETRGWAEPDVNDYERKGNFEERCNVNVDLWESQEFKKATNWDLPFSIPLPNNLPPSMTYFGKGDKLFVRYRLLAIVREATTTKIISVKVNLVKYHLRPVMNLPLKLSGTGSRRLDYDIHLDKTTYNLGETVKISMNLFLLNRRVKFKEIEICLKEYFIYRLTTRNKSRCVVTKIISGDGIHNALDGDEWNTNILLNIPSRENGEEPLLCDIDMNKMKILHKIKFKFKMSKGLFGTGGSIKVEKRIHINNFVSKKMHAGRADSSLAPSEEVDTSPFSQNRLSMQLLPPTRSVSFNEPSRLSDSPPPSYNAPSLPLNPKNLSKKVLKPPPYVSNIESSRNKYRKNDDMASPSISYVSTLEATVNNLTLLHMSHHLFVCITSVLPSIF